MGLDVDFPQEGTSAPERESLQKISKAQEYGHVTKTVATSYVLDSTLTGKKFIIKSDQKFYDYNNMTLPDALKMAKRELG